MTNAPSRAIVAPALIATLALSLAGLLGAAPAQAHNSLVSTSPAEGETITEDPGTVSLTLTGEPQGGDGVTTSIIEVTAGDGHASSSGEVTVDGATISTDVSLEHEDDYTVEWRTVSADGHPIEGSYSFTYDPAGEPVATSEATPSAGDESGQPEDGDAHADADTADETSVDDNTGEPETVDAAPASQDEGTGTGMIIAVAAVVVILAAGAAYLFGRRNGTKNV